MNKNSIFIAATGQNVGKTTICLGLIAGLRKRFGSVGFIKPVGQQHVEINEGLKVDKDVVLFHEVFHLPSKYQDMSPVIIPPGFTREYLDNEHPGQKMQKRIKDSFERIYRSHDYTIVEGTGHVGVGSIVDLNNATVAKSLGLDVIIIATGGLGSAFDELSLNIELCLNKGLRVRGVILNRVLEKKREMILRYFPKALKKWNIPLIGCIPYSEFLNTPTMKDFTLLFNTNFISGHEYRLRHFKQKRLVACSLSAYKDEIIPNELIITPATRTDIIFTLLEKHKTEDLKGGMILTGRHAPDPNTIAVIQSSDVPVLYAPVGSYEAMKMITSYTAKIRKEDSSKVDRAIHLAENNINFDLLCSDAAIIMDNE